MSLGLPTEELDNIEFSDLVIDKEIGKGAFGTVFKATFYGVGVAVKQIKKPSGPDGADFEKYLEREIQVQKCMRHPNIVQFIGVSKKKDETWLALQFVEGGGLDNYLENEKRPMTWDVRLKLALDIAYAMAYLHSKKILYRDLKAKNVVVEETGNGGLKGYLCDFGFARTLGGEDYQRQQAHLTICGTDDYMAPEVILGMPYDQTADVYSFGIFVLELLYRKKLGNILDRQPQNAFDMDKDAIRKKLPADCPPLFTELFLACCEYEPKKRPTFKDITIIVSTMLKNMLKNMPAAAKTNGAPAASPAPAAATKLGSSSTPAPSPVATSSTTKSNSYSAPTPPPAPAPAPALSSNKANRAATTFAGSPISVEITKAPPSNMPTVPPPAPPVRPDTADKARSSNQRAPPTLTKTPSASDLTTQSGGMQRIPTPAHKRSPSSPSVAPSSISGVKSPGLGSGSGSGYKSSTPLSPGLGGGSGSGYKSTTTTQPSGGSGINKSASAPSVPNAVSGYRRR